MATESYAMHHLEQTDDKPFSRLIRTNTYKQVGQFPIKTGWRDSTLVFCNLTKAFEHNIVCDSSGIQRHNHFPLDETHLDAVRGLILPRGSPPAHQQVELIGALRLCSARTSRSAYAYAKNLIQS